jgi:hypothetical protein
MLGGCYFLERRETGLLIDIFTYSGVASLLTTSEACIVDAPEEKAPPAGGMGGGMGGMGGMGF